MCNTFPTLKVSNRLGTFNRIIQNNPKPPTTEDVLLHRRRLLLGEIATSEIPTNCWVNMLTGYYQSIAYHNVWYSWNHAPQSSSVDKDTQQLVGQLMSHAKNKSNQPTKRIERVQQWLQFIMTVSLADSSYQPTGCGCQNLPAGWQSLGL